LKNIYVGNLDSTTTEDQLRALFQSHGTVQTATVVKDRDTGRSRCFAFVEMTNDNEADAAIQALDGTLLGERPIKVNEARPKLETESKSRDQRKHPREPLEIRKHRQHRY